MGSHQKCEVPAEVEVGPHEECGVPAAATEVEASAASTGLEASAAPTEVGQVKRLGPGAEATLWRPWSADEFPRRLPRRAEGWPRWEPGLGSITMWAEASVTPTELWPPSIRRPRRVASPYTTVRAASAASRPMDLSSWAWPWPACESALPVPSAAGSSHPHTRQSCSSFLSGHGQWGPACDCVTGRSSMAKALGTSTISTSTSMSGDSRSVHAQLTALVTAPTRSGERKTAGDGHHARQGDRNRGGAHRAAALVCVATHELQLAWVGCSGPIEEQLPVVHMPGQDMKGPARARGERVRLGVNVGGKSSQTFMWGRTSARASSFRVQHPLDKQKLAPPNPQRCSDPARNVSGRGEQAGGFEGALRVVASGMGIASTLGSAEGMGSILALISIGMGSARTLHGGSTMRHGIIIMYLV